MFRKFLSITLILSFATSVSTAFHVAASGAVDGENAKRRYESIQKEIESKETRMEQVSKQADVTLNSLHQTNRQLLEVERELKKYRVVLDKTRRDIQAVMDDISALSARIEERKDLVKRKLRAMHRYGKYGDTLLVLGASEDLTQLLRRWHYLQSLTLHEQEIIQGYKKDLSALKERQEELRSLQRRLKREETEVLRREKSLSRKKTEKERMLASLRKEKTLYERLLRDLRKTSARMEKIIRESEAKKSAVDRGFRNSKGTLPWPVLGTVAIPYGTQKDPRFHTPVFRNGIYIDASPESVAKAVHTGKVVFADWFKGYGQLVIVNHGGGYHSLYANLAEIFLQTGDIIDRDAEIGRVGTSGLLDRPSLYFEIRYKGKPLDPSQWLKRR